MEYIKKEYDKAVILHIARHKSHLDIIYKGEMIGRIEVSEQNRNVQTSLRLQSNPEETFFKIVKLDSDSRYNKEYFNV